MTNNNILFSFTLFNNIINIVFNNKNKNITILFHK